MHRPRTNHPRLGHAAPLRRGAPPCACTSAAGFTLIELLLVMSVLALVLGMGLGMFAALDLGQRAAAGMVVNHLRAAQNTSLVQRAPTEVRFDTAAGSMALCSSRVLGTWHFEQSEGGGLAGAFGLDAAFDGAQLEPRGFLGQGLRFERGARADFALGSDPDAFRHGFALRCALRADEVAAGNLLSLGGAAGLQLGADGSLRGWFVPRVIGADGFETSGGFATVETAPGALLPGRWQHVELRYDQSRLELYVDQRLLAQLEERAEVWPGFGPLRVSDERQGWVGVLDNLSVWCFALGAREQLPRGAAFAVSTPARVRFAPGGGLDRAAHAGPVRIELELADGARRAVEVGLYGTVQG